MDVYTLTCVQAARETAAQRQLVFRKEIEAAVVGNRLKNTTLTTSSQAANHKSTSLRGECFSCSSSDPCCVVSGVNIDLSWWGPNSYRYFSNNVMMDCMSIYVILKRRSCIELSGMPRTSQE